MMMHGLKNCKCIRKFYFVLSRLKNAKHVNGIVHNLATKDLLISLVVLEQGKNDFETVTSTLKAIFTT
jgi:hypothetical protein